MKKKGYSRILVFLVILFPFASAITAQNIKIKVDAPETVVAGEQFRINYTIESDTDVQKPIIFKEIEGFRILYGPSTSSSLSVTFKNGKRVRTYSFTSAYFLEAIKEGKFNLPKAEISVDGKKYKSEEIQIEVKTADKLIGEVDAFIKTIVSKDRVNLSDTLTLTYRLYTTKEISKIIDADFPSFKGFYSSDITRLRQHFKEETINGKKYNQVDIRKVILQPQEIGQKTIPEGQIIVEYAAPTGKKVRDMWGDVYEETVKSEKTLTIEPVVIRVQDLKAI